MTGALKTVKLQVETLQPLSIGKSATPPGGSHLCLVPLESIGLERADLLHSHANVSVVERF